MLAHDHLSRVHKFRLTPQVQVERCATCIFMGHYTSCGPSSLSLSLALFPLWPAAPGLVGVGGLGVAAGWAAAVRPPLQQVFRRLREGCEEIESTPTGSRASVMAEEKKDFGKGLPCSRAEQDEVREAEAAAHRSARAESGKTRRTKSNEEVREWMSILRSQCAVIE